IGHRPEADFRAGAGGDYGLCPRSGVPADDAVDLRGRPAPLALQGGEAGLTDVGVGAEPDLLERRGGVEVQRLPCLALLGGQLADIVVKTGRSEEHTSELQSREN